MDILEGDASFIFQDIESYLRREVALVEDDIRTVLDEYTSNFIVDDLPLGIYAFNDDLSKVLLKNIQLENDGVGNAIDIQYDDFSMKTKLAVGPANIAITFEEKYFFSSILSFTPHWDYKHYNGYISRKDTNLGTIDKFI